MFNKAVSAALLSFFFSGAAISGELIYTPVNPSFGGASLNSSHLLNIANAQREATASDAGDDLVADTSSTDNSTTGSSDADLFVRQLESRLLSALAGEVTEAIFGDNPQDSGTVQFGETTVTFDRSLESINLTIVDNLDGTITEIVVPQLVTGN